MTKTAAEAWQRWYFGLIMQPSTEESFTAGWNARDAAADAMVAEACDSSVSLLRALLPLAVPHTPNEVGVVQAVKDWLWTLDQESASADRAKDAT